MAKIITRAYYGFYMDIPTNYLSFAKKKKKMFTSTGTRSGGICFLIPLEYGKNN